MSERTMFGEFSLRGYWWLPSAPNDQVSGTLRFSTNDTQLRLDRSFHVGELLRASSPGDYKTDAILGVNTSGEPCTLLRAFYLRDAGQEVILGANALLMGGHFPDADLAVKGALVGFTNLEDWMGGPLVQDVSGSNTEHYIFQIPRSARAVLSIEGCEQFKSLVLWHGPEISQRKTQTTLKSLSHFRIGFDPPANLQGANRLIRTLGNLLALLVGGPVYPTKAVLKTAVNEKEIDVQYLVPPRAGVLPEKSEFEMVFPLRELLDDECAVNLFREWFLKEPLLRPVYDLLLSTVYNPGQYVHSVFLTLAQGLESFHRKTRNGTYTSKDEYRDIRKGLVSAIPAGTAGPLTEKLRSAIAYGNELSLKARIKELLADLTPEHVQSLAGFPEIKTFVSLFTDLRNYLTHYDEKKRPAIVDNTVEMFNLNKRLRAILTLLLFKYLGVPEDRLFLPLKSQLRLF